MPSHCTLHDYVRIIVARETVGTREQSLGSQGRVMMGGGNIFLPGFWTWSPTTLTLGTGCLAFISLCAALSYPEALFPWVWAKPSYLDSFSC